MAVPKTVEEKFAVLETACRKTSREGWPGVHANASAGFFKRPSNVVSRLGRGR